LFCASAVSTERRWFSRSAPPMPPLRSRSRLEVIWSRLAAHLLDLVVDRTALRGAAVEQREEARAFAAHALGLLRDPIEFGLLLGLRFLIAADLFILGGVAGAGATVDRRQLPFEPDADRIALRALLGRGVLVHLRHGVVVRLRQRGRARGGDTEQDGAGQNPKERRVANFQHIRPLRADPRGLESPIARPRRHSAAKVASNSLLLGAASRRFRGAGVAN
jgi:hypothetical protein